MSKTSKADFELFKECCKYWQGKLGLIEWALYFEHAEVGGVYAKTHWSSTEVAATIQFARNWDELRPKNKEEIDKLALHEVLHVLVAPLVSEAQYRYTSDDAINMAEHSIVRRLEKLLKASLH